MGFPNLKNKHVHESLFTPQDFLKYLKRMGRYPEFKAPRGMILCYQRSLLEYILKNHKTTRIRGICNEMYSLDETGGAIAVAGNFGVGSPAAGTVLEELIAYGVKCFISVGTAGALQKNINVGDLRVCEKAIRDEGTSYHYAKPSKYAYPSKKITSDIKAALERSGRRYFTGTTWTIDAPYRETVAEIKRYQKEGVATVEMEASALFAIAEYRRAKLVLRQRNYATPGLTDFEPSRSDVRRAGLKACKPNSAKAQAKSGWPLRGGPFPADFVVAPHLHCQSSAQSSRLELGSGLGLQMMRNFFVATLGAIFTISDSLAELEWKPEFHSEKTGQGLEILYKAAVSVLLDA